MRGLRLPCLLPIGAAFAVMAQAQAPAPGTGHDRLHSESIAFDSRDPAASRIGALRFVGGLVLSGGGRLFGGLSALHVGADGEAVALSDLGNAVHFQIIERGGRPVAVEGLRIVPLRDPQGRIGDKASRDAEALTVDVATGRAEVSFERSNAIFSFAFPPGRIDASDWRATASANPPAMLAWPLNGGAEAMTRLADGRLLLLSEESPGGDGVPALLFDAGSDLAQARPLRFTYLPPAGFQPTDVARLDERRLLILNRRFALSWGVAAALVMIDVADINDGAHVRGREIARLQPPLTVDNMEGMAITRDGARTHVWLLSDDNFNPLQRTLLLKFELRAD